MNAQTTKGTELSTKKRSDPFRALAVKWVSRKYDVSEGYVYNIASNSNLYGGLADEIRKAYRAKYEELKQTLA
jgi:hypothetical protein